MNSSESENREPHRIAVIGGGLSGLVTCYRLLELSRESTQPPQIDLFEQSDRLGGVFGTVPHDGYLIETGADMFITNNPGAIRLVERLGLTNRLIETNARYRRSLILKNGKPLPTPVGFDLMAPRNLLAYVRSPLISIPGKLRALSEYFIPGRPQADESLASFAIRRFGREAFERMIQPMIGGIYTADPEKLSLRSTLPRFLEMEEQYGSLLKAIRKEKQNPLKGADNEASGARYSLFLSFDQGMSVLQDSLIDAIKGHVTLQTGVGIQNIERKQNRYLVTRCNGTTSEYDGVILALPTHAAGQILSQFDPDLTAALQKIEYASAAVAVFGMPLSNSQHPLDCFGLVVPAVERRQILAVSCTSRKFNGRAPEGHIQLRVFMGGAMQQELLEKSDEELIAIARQELADIFGIQGPEDFSRVVRWNRAMPQYHVGHQEKVHFIEERFSTYPALEMAGNGLHGVGIPDVVRTAEQAAERCWQQFNRSA